MFVDDLNIFRLSIPATGPARHMDQGGRVQHLHCGRQGDYVRHGRLALGGRGWGQGSGTIPNCKVEHVGTLFWNSKVIQNLTHTAQTLQVIFPKFPQVTNPTCSRSIGGSMAIPHWKSPLNVRLSGPRGASCQQGQHRPQAFATCPAAGDGAYWVRSNEKWWISPLKIVMLPKNRVRMGDFGNDARDDPTNRKLFGTALYHHMTCGFNYISSLCQWDSDSMGKRTLISWGIPWKNPAVSPDLKSRTTSSLTWATRWEAREHDWLMVSGWFQPLWKILVNWDDYSQYMGK